ncbi:hypothetical protein Taro_033814 [Colocasia esculenta]|uniref:Autophagy-related protein 18b n=1 Tax=Colocasia esculenta TaxID=4460 RepID=A0A843W150_COLES|nr:hypothetical protein [Colocasia esculenta]
MASKSSPAPPPPILCASFNQDNSCFAIGTRDGVRVFDARTGRLFYERHMGSFSIVEMLFSSSLLAIVGAGEQPSLSPRRLCLFDTVTEATRRELNFLTSILAVRLNRKRLIVVLQDKTYIYDLNSVAILDTIDTVPNPKGLCAFSPSSDACYLALPASKTKGSVLIYNTIEIFSLCQIDAHQRPLAAIAFSSSGMYLATASEQGTIIRVHLVSQATKSSNANRPCSMLGSMIPDKINGALESAHHHVLHNAAPQGMKSYAIIHSADKVGSTMQMSTSAIRYVLQSMS